MSDTIQIRSLDQTDRGESQERVRIDLGSHRVNLYLSSVLAPLVAWWDDENGGPTCVAMVNDWPHLEDATTQTGFACSALVQGF